MQGKFFCMWNVFTMMHTFIRTGRLELEIRIVYKAGI